MINEQDLRFVALIHFLVVVVDPGGGAELVLDKGYEYFVEIS